MATGAFGGRMARPLATVGRRAARSRVFNAVVAAAGGKAALPHKTFSVMTYNILAQKYAQSGRHSYCPSHHLQWEYRKKLILEELEVCGSDVICLQEVEVEVFSRELQPWLAERGYRGHYLARQYGENVQGPPEGVALFYRTAVFELLRHRSLVFSAVPIDPPVPSSTTPVTSPASSISASFSSLDLSEGEEEGAELADAAAAATATAATATAATATAAPPAAAPVADDDGSGNAANEARTADSWHHGVAEAGAGPAGRAAAGDVLQPAVSPSARPAKAASAATAVVAVAAPLPGRQSSSANGSSRGSSSSSSTSTSNSTTSTSSSTPCGNSESNGRGKGATKTAATAAADTGRMSLDADASPSPSPSRFSSPLGTSGRGSNGSSTRGAGSSRSSSSNSGGRRSSRGGGGGGNNEFWSVFARRQEGAILALLRHVPSQRPVLAAVTHLFWNPAFPDVKAFQAAVLCQEIAAFLHQYAATGDDGGGGGASNGSKSGGRAAAAAKAAAVASVPVVLAGDFNSMSSKQLPDAFDPKIPRSPKGLVSGVYSLLTRGSLPPDHPDHPAARRRPGETGNPDFHGRELTTSGLELASAYHLANGREPPLTTRTSTFAGCLDYIFVSPRNLDVARTLELPYDLPYKSSETAVCDPLSDVDFSPIPNAAFPSDHISLVAMLRLKDG